MLFKLKVPANPEYVGVVRLAVSALVSRLNFSFEEIEDIKLSVAEACTVIINQVKGKDDLVVDASLTKNIFRLRISNTRTSLDRLQILEIIDNMGFCLIKALMDEVEVESKDDKGSQIIIKKKMIAE